MLGLRVGTREAVETVDPVDRGGAARIEKAEEDRVSFSATAGRDRRAWREASLPAAVCLRKCRRQPSLPGSLPHAVTRR